MLTCGTIDLSNNGQITLIFNSYNPKIKLSKFEIYGSLVKKNSKNQALRGFREFLFSEKILFY